MNVCMAYSPGSAQTKRRVAKRNELVKGQHFSEGTAALFVSGRQASAWGRPYLSAMCGNCGGWNPPLRRQSGIKPLALTF